jgi:hypothetical protein
MPSTLQAKYGFGSSNHLVSEASSQPWKTLKTSWSTPPMFVWPKNFLWPTAVAKHVAYSFPDFRNAFKISTVTPCRNQLTHLNFPIRDHFCDHPLDRTHPFS